MALPPEQAMLAQAKLDHNVTRIDQEMARAMGQYDAAREQRAAHYRQMDKLTKERARTLAQLREKLVPVFFQGQSPYPEFQQDCDRYLELLAQFGQARQARGMSWPATQKPGTPGLSDPQTRPEPPAGADAALPDE